MNTKVSAAALVLALVGAAACGDDTTDPSGAGGSSSAGGGESGDGGSTTSTGSGTGGGDATSTTSSTGGGGAPACDQLAPADRDRFVVVGRPAIPDYQVLVLSASGELSATEHTFTMGEANDVPIAFTPDGRIGVAVQNDGSLGVFTLSEDGTPTVIDPAFQPGGPTAFHVNGVVMAPSGDHVVGIDGDWQKHGGGLYRVDLDCATGTPALVGQVIPTKNTKAILPLGEGRWLVQAREVGPIAENANDVFDVRVGEPWAQVAAVDAFDHELPWAGAFMAARDGSFALIGDVQELFEGVGSEVRFIDTSDGSLALRGATVPLEDPYDVEIGPTGRTALFASGYGNALVIADIDPSAAAPITIRGEVDYVDNPQLPGKMTMVQRGSLDGLVLGSDVAGIRVVRFVGDDVVDHGVYTDSGSNIYAIGIQP